MSIELDHLSGKVLVNGKGVTGARAIAAIKKYVLYHIKRGQSINSLGLTGEGSIPHCSEVLGWEREDSAFSLKLEEACRIRDKLNLEIYQDAINTLRSNYGQKSRDVVSALEKQIQIVEKHRTNSKPTTVILEVSRSFPEDQWVLTSEEKEEINTKMVEAGDL